MLEFGVSWMQPLDTFVVRSPNIRRKTNAHLARWGKNFGNTSHEKETEKMIRHDNLERLSEFKFNIAFITIYDDNSRTTGYIM